MSYSNRLLLCLTLAATMWTSPPARCQDARSEEDFARTTVHVDRGNQGMVVSDSAPASRIGRDILRQGRSAVDAAVATEDPLISPAAAPSTRNPRPPRAARSTAVVLFEPNTT